VVAEAELIAGALSTVPSPPSELRDYDFSDRAAARSGRWQAGKSSSSRKAQLPVRLKSKGKAQGCALWLSKGHEENNRLTGRDSKSARASRSLALQH
jgi:hypothetical protein